MLGFMPYGRPHRHAPDVSRQSPLRRLSDRGIQPTSSALVRAMRAARDVLVPPQCLGCASIVDTDDVLCPSCWADIDFITKPMCEICGLPFAFDQFSTICAGCAKDKPAYGRARSAVIYNDKSRRLIVAYKHSDRMEAAGLFSRWLIGAGEDLLGDADVIVPVPLHRARLFTRRFNQSAVLANRLSRETGVPTALEALVRVKPSPLPGKSTRGQRRRAVAGAFRINQADRVAGRRVLVIDDVMTTGATAQAVAGQLRRAKASAVDVLTIARVVRD